jgi:hypothetical protein
VIEKIKSIGKSILFLVLFFTGLIISQLIPGLLPFAGEINPGLVIFFINLLSLIFILLFAYVLRRYLDKKSFVSLGFKTKGWVVRFGTGSFMSIIILMSGFFIQLRTGMLHIDDVQFNSVYLVSSLFMCIVTAVIEEVTFRGYILNNLMEGFNKYTALVISALLFSIAHLLNADISIFPVTNIFLAGILLGATYIYTRNLWFPIGFHLFWNFVQGVLGYNVSGGEMPAVLILSYPENNIYNGGDFGFEGSILCTLFLIISIVVIFRYYYNKGVVI